MRCFILLNKAFAFHFVNHIVNLLSQFILNIRERSTNSSQSTRYIIINLIFRNTVILNGFNYEFRSGPCAFGIASTTTKIGSDILVCLKKLGTIYGIMRILGDLTIGYIMQSNRAFLWISKSHTLLIHFTCRSGKCTDFFGICFLIIKNCHRAHIFNFVRKIGHILIKLRFVNGISTISTFCQSCYLFTASTNTIGRYFRTISNF